MPIRTVDTHRFGMRCRPRIGNAAASRKRAERHERGAVADAIGQQAEERRRDDRGQEHVAVQRPGILQREAVRVLEILDGERAAERERSPSRR